MKTRIDFIKTIAVLIFMIGILTPAVSTAQNAKPEFSPVARGEYCIPFSDCSYGDGFEIFVLGEIENLDSGCSPDGYGDFTLMQTSLAAGEEYFIEIVCLYGENNVCVWIDFNDDEVFAPDEMLVEDFFLADGGAVYEIPIAIPPDAMAGEHRLRARSIWDETASDPCAGFMDGETEDYTVEIIGGGGFTDIGIVSIDIPEFISPGPVVPKVTLQNFGTTTFTQQIGIINNVDYGTSAFVYDMLPGEIRQITFGEWNAQIGVYTFHVYFAFEDDNLYNNQLFKDITVEVPNVEPPQNPIAQLQGNSVVLSWDAPSSKNVLGYRVYSNGVRLADSLSQTSFTDFCLVNGNYNYTLTALYDVGESPNSDTVEILVDLCELQIFEEGFEAFAAEQHLVVQADSMDIDYWHCWSQEAGSVEDPYITEEIVAEGQNAMVIQELNDVILELGGKTEGKWEVRFKVYVPAGFDGFFGIWREFSSYSPGLELYFDADQTGTCKIANSNWEWFTYPIETWNSIVASFDLDNDWSKMYINGQMVAQAQWSLDENGDPGPKKLDGIDFYAGTLWEGVPKSFVDKISLQRVIDDALPPENLQTEVNLNNVTLSWDAPIEGIIEYEIYRDENLLGSTFDLHYLDEGLLPGGYTYKIVAEYGLCQSQPSASAIAIVYPFQIINIPAGWSGLSGCIDPANPNIESLFQEVVGDLIILQNESGMYWPGQNINTLISWDAHCGYKIKTSEAICLSLCGPAHADKTIALIEGWNLIPVLSSCDVEIADLFAGQDLILAKEIAGSKVYWPEYGIQSLQILQSGKAYFVLMGSEGSIEFEDCARASSRRTPSNSPPDGRRSGQHIGFGDGVGLCAGTPITHTIAIPANVVDENLAGKFLAAFGENNTCYGFTLLTGQNDALTLSGDDATTLEQDGFLENEKLDFKIWDNLGSEKRNVEVVFGNSLPQNNGAFVTDGISVIQQLKFSINNIEVDELIQIRVFPNPAKDFLNIQMQEVQVESCDAIITDLQGREMNSFQISDGDLRLNISELKRGIYVLKIFRHGKTYVEKLVIE